MRRLGLDPRLGAELGEAADQPLGGPPLALGGGRTVDPLQFLEPLAQPVLVRSPSECGDATRLPWRNARWRLYHALPRPRDPDLGRLVLVPDPLPGHLLDVATSTTTCSASPSSADRRRSCWPSLSAVGFFGSILLHELGHAVVAHAQRDRDHQHPALDLRRHGADGPRSRQPRRRTRRSPLAGPAGDPRDRRRPHRRRDRRGGRPASSATRAAARIDRAASRGSLAMVAWLAVDQRSWSWSSTCCRPSRWTAAASPARSPGGGPATAPRRPASPPTSAASSATSSSPPALPWCFDRRHSSAAIWLALIGMVINGSARGAAMQTAITSRIDDDPRRRRDGPRTGRDPRRHQRRAGARRVLPALPLALVPGRRRRPPLPRPARTRPRRRGPRGLPRQLPRLRPGRRRPRPLHPRRHPARLACSATRTCAGSAP